MILRVRSSGQTDEWGHTHLYRAGRLPRPLPLRVSLPARSQRCRFRARCQTASLPLPASGPVYAAACDQGNSSCQQSVSIFHRSAISQFLSENVPSLDGELTLCASLQFKRHDVRAAYKCEVNVLSPGCLIGKRINACTVQVM